MTTEPRHPYTGRKFRDALRHFFIGRSAQAVASVVFLLVAVRLLEPEDFGSYMVLLGIVEVCRPLSSLGLLPAVQQFLPAMALHAGHRQLTRFVRWISLLRFGALVAFGAGVYVFWPALADALGLEGHALNHGALIALLIVTMLGAGFNDHMLEALLEQRRAQMLRAFVPVGRLIGLVALAIWGQATLVWMLWIDIVVTGACLIAAEWILAGQLRRLTPDGSRTFAPAEIGRFVWHMSGAQVLNALSSPGMLRMIVSSLLGVTAAGQFAFIQQVVLQVQRFMPSLLLANLVRPMLIAARAHGNDARVREASALLWKSNSILVLPLVSMAWLGGVPLMHVLSGHRIDDSLTLGLLMLGLLSAAQLHVTGTLMQLLQRAATLRNLSLMALLAPGLVAVTSVHGLAWAAAGATLAAWLRSATSLVVLSRIDPLIRPDIDGTIRALASAAMATALAWPLASLSVWAGVGAMPIAYLFLLWLTKPLNQADVGAVGLVFKSQRGLVARRAVEAFARGRSS